MIRHKDNKRIKEAVETFFNKMTVPVNIKIGYLKDQTLPIELETEDPKILIGEKGQTLLDVQKLLKIILKRKIGESFYVDLDVNNYKKKKIDYLREIARAVADEVALNKKERILTSMVAYERRIIHMELADRKNIVTESIGEEPYRRVAVRPYP